MRDVHQAVLYHNRYQTGVGGWPTASFKVWLRCLQRHCSVSCWEFATWDCSSLFSSPAGSLHAGDFDLARHIYVPFQTRSFFVCSSTCFTVRHTLCLRDAEPATRAFGASKFTFDMHM